LGIVDDRKLYNIRSGGQLFRQMSDLRSAVGQFFHSLFEQVVHGEVVPGVKNVNRHRFTDTAQSDESDADHFRPVCKKIRLRSL
jgi:hypothetical protein